MKKYIWSALLLALGAFGCDSNNNFCDENADCATVCSAYDGNRVIYACESGTCKCVANEYMACTGDAETDKCADICAKYRPGTVAVCDEGYCDCLEKECDKADECTSHCAGAVKQACVSNFCQCLEASALACSGDDADTYCAGICEVYEPGSMPSCTDGTCVCKSTACTSESDCSVLCESVGAAMTACVSGKCECIGSEALACAGEDGTSRCNKICAAYKPNALAVCQNGTCTCKDL